MPRQAGKPEIDLEPFKEQILLFLTQNKSYSSIASWLTQQGVKCAARTIRRRISHWKVPQRLPLEDSPEVRALVYEAYCKFNANDVEIAQIVKKDLDVVLTPWGVARLRIRLGCHRRFTAIQAIQAQERFTEALTQKIGEGHIQVVVFFLYSLVLLTYL